MDLMVVWEMRTIILTYPEFQSLPRGIKQMLLATESFYFGETEVAVHQSNVHKPKETHPAHAAVVTRLGQPVELRVAA